MTQQVLLSYFPPRRAATALSVNDNNRCCGQRCGKVLRLLPRRRWWVLSASRTDGLGECFRSASTVLLKAFQIVQGLLGIFVILSLVFKRHRESPKRPWRIWFAVPFGPSILMLTRIQRLFDVSKQVAGQMFIHVANLLVAGLSSHHDLSNACVSYFLNILIDTTLGEHRAASSIHS